ncbi:HesA/MoeB/ThiF family protein [Gammaproteobacteria bacterium]|nr:HesA/MoeB/ThiF family protein [Gammaproteobacteria bacterium]|tara:strand:+ start:1389 stop:2126 length:738 start_codon:yes stop_codon:yes gene_type:complete
MNIESQRYNAHLRLNDFDESSQKLIEDSSILIIGMGGIGTIASLYLVNSGVGEIILCDYDSVDISNLPRQVLFQEDNINQNKAIVAKEKLHHFNPNVLIESIDKKLNDSELDKIISKVSLVIDCTDNIQTRLQLNKICIRNRKPMIMAAAIRYECHIAVFRNDSLIDGCLNCLYQSDEENLETCEGNGVLSTIAGSAGIMAATEALKILMGQNTELNSMISIFDLKNNINQILKINKSNNCNISH